MKPPWKIGLADHKLDIPDGSFDRLWKMVDNWQINDKFYRNKVSKNRKINIDLFLIKQSICQSATYRHAVIRIKQKFKKWSIIGQNPSYRTRDLE